MDKWECIAENLQKARKKCGYSYQKLADKTGLSKSTLQRYESGAIRSLPLEKAEQLAQALNITPAELLGWHELNQYKELGNLDRLREKQQRENLRPLTLDELRKMDGQPVWGQSLISDKPGEWFIVRIVEMSATWFIACAGATQGFGDKDTYEESWLAYRRPPEKALEEMEEKGNG